MELRHLRYFVAVAEELHFQRAAERLHMEQSPLSRAIKELEGGLGVQLLERNSRSTRITEAGQVFLDEARRVLAALERACASTRAAAQGPRDSLKVGFSDGLAQPRLAALFAECREQEPDLELQLFDLSLSQQVKRLRSGTLDVGLALCAEVGEGIAAEPVWHDRIAMVLPAGHPLAAKRRVTLAEAVSEPLILCHPEFGPGGHAQLEKSIHRIAAGQTVTTRATSLSVMMILVGAGYGIGLANAVQVGKLQLSGVVVRPLAGRSPVLTTYLLHAEDRQSEPLARFLCRVRPAGERLPS